MCCICICSPCCCRLLLLLLVLQQQELHARLEPLLIFTIDGANFIDVSDDKWEVVVAVVNMRGRQYMVRESHGGWLLMYVNVYV